MTELTFIFEAIFLRTDREEIFKEYIVVFVTDYSAAWDVALAIALKREDGPPFLLRGLTYLDEALTNG